MCGLALCLFDILLRFLFAVGKYLAALLYYVAGAFKLDGEVVADIVDEIKTLIGVHLAFCWTIKLFLEASSSSKRVSSNSFTDIYNAP